jgi:hypothetical protein
MRLLEEKCAAVGMPVEMNKHYERIKVAIDDNLAEVPFHNPKKSSAR